MPPISHADLDNLSAESIRARDPHGMLGLVIDFPEQCARAVEIAKSVRTAISPVQGLSNILITGMGGSAIGADFVRCLMDDAGAVPVIVNRDYGVPAWVGPETLVIAASYSGNTEETLAAYAAARAKRARLAAVTSGGALLEEARRDGAISAVVPGGQPPRSALGNMFFPILGILQGLEVAPHGIEQSVDETLRTLGTQLVALGPTSPTAENPAKRLAVDLHGTLPVIYGADSRLGAAAVRWKGQINENAKLAAFASALPEMNHNEILSWVSAARQSSAWSVVFLRDSPAEAADPRLARRVELTAQIIDGGHTIREVWSTGSSVLARLFSLVHFADYLSVYLAFLNGVCPTDISHIDTLKRELAR